MTLDEARDFGRNSVMQAIDQVGEYSDMDTSLINYYENMQDTCQNNEEFKAAEHVFLKIMKENNLTCRYL